MELLVREIPSGARAHLDVVCYGAPEVAPFQNVSYCATSFDSVVPQPLDFAIALESVRLKQGASA
jgi:hypothetical protein